MPSAPQDEPQALPQHVAVIMDGNGRWATARGLSRTEGHKKGAEAAQRAVEAARDMGIPYITLFTFSSENWNRPASEVDDLMNLLRFYLKKETAELHKSGARLRVIGDRTRLPKDIVKLIESAEEKTRDNDRITVVIAISYGGRDDIVQAARHLAALAKANAVDIEKSDEDLFAQALMTEDIPDPDLMIRTSGEYRISNFLMWQLAYSEMYFTHTLWPDFGRADMEEAVRFFNGRERRYGGLSSRKVASSS
ncbi:MAG: isoprenyl transferase [Alphaproteobacteria bacterium]|nr:isoprenyl transferase [Alphaproteobacteria bacterium]